jgi:phosphoglycerol transferase
VLACVAVGSFNAYWAVFGVITIVLATSVSAILNRTIRPLLHGAAFTALIAVTAAINQAGTLLYQLDNGDNAMVGRRYPVELDVYGLRLIQLLTPVPGGRLSFLNGLSKDLTQGYQSEPSQYLGLVGSLALLTMLVWFIVRAAGRGATRPASDPTGMLAALVVLWILIASTGGLNWLTVPIGFNRIRAWNRVSVLIMFCVLAWAAHWFPPLLSRATSRFRKPYKPLAMGAAAVLLLVGLADQSSGSYILDARIYESDFRSDRDFFVGIESELPPSSDVFILPIRRFPEEVATGGSTDYDLLRGYLQTKTLRFSYGGMKGREAEWQQRLAGREGDDLVEALVATGFDAIVIDRYGYADRAAQLEQSLSATLATGPRPSANGRFSYYSLLDWADDADADELAATREELLGRPVLTLPDCSPWEGPFETGQSWCGESGAFRVITLEEPDGRAVSFSVTAPGRIGTLQVSGRGTTQRYEIGAQPVRIELPPGDERFTDYSFATDVSAMAAPGDTRDLRFIVSDVAS